MSYVFHELVCFNSYYFHWAEFLGERVTLSVASTDLELLSLPVILLQSFLEKVSNKLIISVTFHDWSRLRNLLPLTHCWCIVIWINLQRGRFHKYIYIYFEFNSFILSSAALAENVYGPICFRKDLSDVTLVCRGTKRSLAMKIEIVRVWGVSFPTPEFSKEGCRGCGNKWRRCGETWGKQSNIVPEKLRRQNWSWKDFKR